MPHVETVQCARWTCVPQPEGALPHGGQSGNVAFRESDALTTDKAASAMLTSATCKASTPLPKLSDICGTCESRFGADFSPLSSYRSPQAALKFSYRGDRVTRDGPLALRVPAAKNKTCFFALDGPLPARALGTTCACAVPTRPPMRRPPPHSEPYPCRQIIHVLSGTGVALCGASVWR